MAFVPVPDTAELVATYTLPNGNQAKNVYNFREANLAPYDPALLQGLITLFVNWENTTAKVKRSNQVTLTNVLARDLNTADSYVIENAVSIVGGSASPALPANVTFCVKSVTGLAGRTHRGRTYWVGLPEGAVVGDLLQTSDATAIVAALNTLRTSMATSLFQMVVVSRQLNNVPRTVGLATDITSWQAIDNRVDTQRRRLIGEGS